MAVIPVTAKALRGTAIPFQNSAAGDQVDVGPNMILLCWNSSAGVLTATFAVPGTDELTGGAKPDNIESVAAGEIRMVPLDPRYADAAIGNRAAITYQTPGATFKVAAISVV